MNIVFATGTLALLGLMYWGAYINGKEIKTIEIQSNLLLQFPEFVFKLLLLGLCMGLASSLDVARPDKYFGWPTQNLAFDIIAGICLGLVCQFGVNTISALAIRFFGSDIYSPIVLKNVIPKNTLEWFLIIIPLLLAVLVEEVLFRALAIGGFSTVINSWVLAVASSILFGMVHVTQGKLGMLVSGTVGFVLAAIFIVANSLLLVITGHFVLNLLQLIRAKEDENWLKRFQNPPPAP